MWNELLLAIILKDRMFLASPFPCEEFPACSQVQTLRKYCGISHANRNCSATGWINSALPCFSVYVTTASPVAKPTALKLWIWQVLFWISSRQSGGLLKRKRWCFSCRPALVSKTPYSAGSCPAQFRGGCLCALSETLQSQGIKVETLQTTSYFDRCPDLQSTSCVGG